jgi:hypothetical protein
MFEAADDGREAWRQLENIEQESLAALINPQETDTE